MSDVDFGRTAVDYATYRKGYPDRLFLALQRFDVGLSGQTILDLGTGTGYLARELAKSGAVVTGLDPARLLMDQAKELDKNAGVSIEYVHGLAEDTKLSTGTWDVVTAGQCWHWFDGDKAARECRRLLKPGGRLVICHLDWIPLPGNQVHATEHLILKYNNQWAMGGGTGIYPRWSIDVATNGFINIETLSFDEYVEYSHEQWRGRIRASAGVGASLSPEKVKEFDAEHAEILARSFPEDPMRILHRCWTLTALKPA